MRRTILLRENWHRAEVRARELGFNRLEVTEATRNPGDRRTEVKRHLLASVSERTIAGGLLPFEAYWKVV